MPDPDIEALQRQLRNAQAVANAPNDPHDDRQGHARARARDAEDQALFLGRQIADLSAKRKADLAAIHTEAKRAGIDEETRRAMIERLSQGRTNSSADLTAAQRAALLREIGAGTRRTPGRGPKPQTMDRNTMAKKVGALIAEARLPWSYAEAILRRQRGIQDKGVACPIDAASEPELRGVIAALYRRAKSTQPA